MFRRKPTQATGVDRVSKRQARGSVYQAIVRLAEPGDLVFFISEVAGDTPFPWPRRWYRRWQGFAAADRTDWHTALYTGAVKERRGGLVRPYIIHAHQGGVTEEHLPPSFFTSGRTDNGTVLRHSRVEFLRCAAITDADRAQVVAFCREKLGKPFADLGWRYDLPTYAFGLPGRFLTASRVSCHGLAFEAYARIGLRFPHQLAAAPAFNLGRWRGHPFGHPPDHVDLRRLYLRDHHLYRDPRFVSVLAVYDEPVAGTLKVAEAPGKYAWHPGLQGLYASSN